MQNLDTWEAYSQSITSGRLPISRGYVPNTEERFIREFILQLKRGAVQPGYFVRKYGIDPLERFAEEVASIEREGFLAERSPERVALTRDGLLRVDTLLHRFFLPHHRGIRYT
jgi:oxygen-independent coproporphyrinogen-3 oxidase